MEALDLENIQKIIEAKSIPQELNNRVNLLEKKN